MVAAIRPKGTLLLYGLMDGATVNLSVMDMLFNSKVLPKRCTGAKAVKSKHLLA